MKNRIIKIISLILCISIVEGQIGNNPCEDKKYLQIVEKMDKEGIASLSEPEWKYYALKDRECVEYSISLKYLERTDEKKQLEKGRGIVGLVIALGLFGILIAVIISANQDQGLRRN